MTTHGDATPLEPFLPDLTRFAAAHFGEEPSTLPSRIRELKALAPSELVGRWRTWLADDAGVSDWNSTWREPQRWFGAETRQRDGMFATPPSVAAAMASAVAAGDPAVVVDPAAGDGRLLAATIRAAPGAAVVGIERHPAMALAAAVRIAQARRSTGTSGAEDQVLHGDGLHARRDWPGGRSSVDAVIMNPPYVGEKGQGDRFRGIAQRHPDLAERMSARGDLAYLFIHRALDWLDEGGRLVALTPEYWLTATGARTLRCDLMRRSAVRWMIRAPACPLFKDAPGHHSMLARFDRTSASTVPATRTLEEVPDDWRAVVRLMETEAAGMDASDRELDDRFEPTRWTPFVDGDVQHWGRALREVGTRLEELAVDRQGFVSGADRLSTRRYNTLDDPPSTLDVGDPLFLWQRDELQTSADGERLGRVAGTVVRPVLRGGDIDAGRLIREPPEQTRVLYIDGALEERHRDVVAHLQPVRPALEGRREVRKGRMPWYRLHWPRDRAEQTGPKLVTPRRARRSGFALDLSGSAVSSDCTYVVAPRGVSDVLEYLVTLMVALNRPAVTDYLRAFGKTKGDLVELYADPLRRLPLPLTRTDAGLQWVDSWLDAEEVDRLQARVETVLRRIQTGAG